MGDPGALDGELAVLLVEHLRQRAVTVEEERAEAEELHLLGVLVVGEDVLEVQQAARLRRAPVAHAEGDLRVAHLGDGRRDGGGEEADHRPPAELHEEDAVADERDEVLDELEALRHEGDGP